MTNKHNLSKSRYTDSTRMKEMPPDEYKKARESLLKYCELDTYLGDGKDLGEIGGDELESKE